MITDEGALLIKVNRHKHGYNGKICEKPNTYECGANPWFRQNNCARGQGDCFDLNLFHETQPCFVKSIRDDESNIFAKQIDLLNAGKHPIIFFYTIIRNRFGTTYPMVGAYVVKAIEVEKGLFRATYNVYPNEDSFPLQTYSINKLYEIWVVNIVARVMVKRLGFKLTNNEYTLVDTRNPFPIIKSGQTIELISPLGQRVLFHYDKQYPSLENPFCLEKLGFVAVSLEGRNRISKNNPDIAIEFYEKGDKPPRILIFDATFSNNPAIHREKSYYENTIRYRSSIDTPRSDWELPVCQAIAVHPFPYEDGLFRQREVALVPTEGADDQAEVWLRWILKRERLI